MKNTEMRNLPSQQDLEDHVLALEEVNGTDESKMLEELDLIFVASKKAHEKEVLGYQSMIQKLNHTLELARQQDNKYIVAKAFDKLQEEILHFEETHPKAVRAIENIINIFSGLGMV